MDTLAPESIPKRYQARTADRAWVVVCVVIALVVMTPILTIAVNLFTPPSENWAHLVDTVLPDYVLNSVVLMIGVALCAGCMGVSTAWFVAMYEFPGKRYFSWALLLPLAMPAYIVAYTYTGMLDVSGPVQEWIRLRLGLEYGEYWFPQIRSLGGAVAMLSLVLYPYVYLMSRAAFIEQSVCVLEASRTLGCSPWQSLSHVAIPLARPAIVAGLSLVMMETLADYGTVQYFGVSTFTTGIFRTWFGMGDPISASQLSAILLLFVFVLIMAERWSRHRARYHHTTNRYQVIEGKVLKGFWAWVGIGICLFPVLFGFVVPALQLSIWALETYDTMVDQRFWILVMHSFTLAAGAALIVLVPAVLLAYGVRDSGSKVVSIVTRIAAMGYAIPGTVIAVGVLIPFASLDRFVNSWSKETFGTGTGLLFSGTVFILLFAYTVRFLAVSLQAAESGLGRVRPSMDDAARSLGYTRSGILKNVHLPIMKGSMLTALVIVFVDVLKELPATLVLRPFDYNTLAVRAYELASDERLADSSTAALAIVLVGIIPVIVLSRAIDRSRPGRKLP